MLPDRGNALRLLIAFVGLILYASFYPFEADWARLSDATLYWNSSTTGDRVINVLAYVPLGTLLVASGCRVASATALGFLLSLAVELGQNAAKQRNPNVYDVLTNGIGTLLGALFCSSRVRQRIARFRLIDLASPAGLLLLLWLAIHSVPLIAVLEPEKLHTTFVAGWTPLEAIRWCAMWTVFATAAARLFGGWLPAAILAVVSLPTPFFFWKQYLTANELIAMFPGILLARIVPPRILFALVALAVGIPSNREPHHLFWLDTVFLAAGAGWILATEVKQRSIVAQG
jgi:glycopeptide antibiotics resistance protein